MIPALLDLLRDFLRDIGVYPFLMVFERVSFRGFAAGGLSLALTLIFGKRIVRWLASKKIGDKAKFDVAALDKALASKANTPTMGGLMIAGSMLASILVFGDLRNQYVVMAVVVLLWMAALGAVDDWLKLTAGSRPGGSRQGLYAWEKLVFQLGLGVLVGYFAWRYGDSPPNLSHVLNLPLQKTYEAAGGGVAEGLVYLSKGAFIVVMTLMLTGMSNAVNITDGMDGLASGVTSLVCFGLFVLVIIAGWDVAAQYLLVPYVPFADELAIVVGAMAGACLGFLWWNCAPAIVFMGDTGSLCLGGLLGYIAVVVRQEFAVLLMSGVFLLEIASVVLQVGWFKYTARRYGEGRRIFRCAPFHWHLHMGGWAEQKIVARLWIVSAVIVALALASIKLR